MARSGETRFPAAQRVLRSEWFFRHVGAKAASHRHPRAVGRQRASCRDHHLPAGQRQPRGRGESVGLRYPGQNGPVVPARWPRTAAAAALLAAASLLAPSADSASAHATAASSGASGLLLAPAGSSPGELAQLEARAAKLARLYRGQLLQLTDADGAAKAAAARVLRLRSQLGQAWAARRLRRSRY
jgi:hypothetical protein